MARIVRRSTSDSTSTGNVTQTDVVKENQVSHQSDNDQLDDGLPLKFPKSEENNDNETVFTSEESSQKASELLAKAAEIKSKSADNANLIQEHKFTQGSLDGVYKDPFGDQFADSNLEAQDPFQTSEITHEMRPVHHSDNVETEDEAYNEVMNHQEVMNHKEVSDIEEKPVTVEEVKVKHTENLQQEVTTSIENANLSILSKEQIGKYQSQLQELDIENQIAKLKELNQKRSELERRRIHLDAREEQVNKNIAILTEKIQALTGKTDINEICQSLVDAYEETETALEKESKLLEDQENIIKAIEEELNGL